MIRGSDAASVVSNGGPIFAGLGDLFDRFLELLRQGQEAAAVAEAKRGGIDDVNELTNLVFLTSTRK